MVFKTENNVINAWHVVSISQADYMFHQPKYGKNILQANKLTNNYQRSINAVRKPYNEGLIHIDYKRRQKFQEKS
ncbi:MAG: hypothetical protein PHE08_00780 [Bacteroidales bacterium]|nr:hypothetical protein [Bacteroidales bacterium]